MFEATCIKQPAALTNDKILDWSKLKAFADDKLKVAKIMTSVLDSVENIVGNGENAGYHSFFPPQCFHKRLLFGIVKSQDCVVKS